MMDPNFLELGEQSFNSDGSYNLEIESYLNYANSLLGPPTRKSGVHFSPIDKKSAKPSLAGLFYGLSYFLLFIGLPFTTASLVLGLVNSFRCASITQ